MPASNNAKTASARKLLPTPLQFVVFLTTALVVMGALSYSAVPPVCNEEYRPDRRVVTAGATLEAEVAETEQERMDGLSWRRCMPDGRAMLFIFEKPGTQCFWMKDMRFGIDIVWLGEQHTVTHIESSVMPESYPQRTYCPAEPARYVLEIPAGSAGRYGLKNGSFVDF